MEALEATEGVAQEATLDVQARDPAGWLREVSEDRALPAQVPAIPASEAIAISGLIVRIAGTASPQRARVRVLPAAQQATVPNYVSARRSIVLEHATPDLRVQQEHLRQGPAAAPAEVGPVRAKPTRLNPLALCVLV